MDSEYQGVWRLPPQETADYPGLVVNDGRVTGSITFGATRLPVWCIIGELFHGAGWDGVESEWAPSQYGWDSHKFGDFIYNLLEMRGEFARLLCILADVEREEGERLQEVYDAAESDIINITPGDPEAVVLPPSWWEYAPSKQRVIDQLRRCLAALTQ